MCVVVIALNGGFLDGQAHAFDLPFGLRMFDLGEAVLDIVLLAVYVEHMGNVAGGEAIGVARQESGCRYP